MDRNTRDTDPEDIKAAIRKTGITLSALSTASGYCRAAVTITLRRPWPGVQALIASRLGQMPQEIWPSRYDAEGSPLRGIRSNKRNSNRSRRAPHRQKQEAV